MKTSIFRSGERGHVNHGWLISFHTFSFGEYYDSSKMNFGALRVLNDDTVLGGMGFGRHPHDNMEIVSIPLSGSLEHQDSMGNKTIIKQGEVQIMSAGTGIFHSEKNASHNEPVKFLQIWIMPDKKQIMPRYDQKVFDLTKRLNTLQTVVSPIGTDHEGVKINQNAWFSLINLENTRKIEYPLFDSKNGLFVFVLEGQIKINDTELNKRDGLGIWETNITELIALENSEILIIEVPMMSI